MIRLPTVSNHFNSFRKKRSGSVFFLSFYLVFWISVFAFFGLCFSFKNFFWQRRQVFTLWSVNCVKRFYLWVVLDSRDCVFTMEMNAQCCIRLFFLFWLFSATFFCCFWEREWREECKLGRWIRLCFDGIVVWVYFYGLAESCWVKFRALHRIKGKDSKQRIGLGSYVIWIPDSLKERYRCKWGVFKAVFLFSVFWK